MNARLNTARAGDTHGESRLPRPDLSVRAAFIAGLRATRGADSADDLIEERFAHLARSADPIARVDTTGAVGAMRRGCQADDE